jgi:nucleoid-associated protein YgaU
MPRPVPPSYQPEPPKLNIKAPVSRRSKASTPLPLPSNNFASLGYSFILLDENSRPIQEITLAVAPEDFQQAEVSTSNVVMTAGDAFTDSFGPGLTQIVLSGTFGQRPTGTGVASSSGQYLVLQLRDMFRKYLDKLNPITEPSAKKNASTVLQFYNPKDNEFWNIEPVGNWFQLSRSKSSPFLYRYKLSFVCTGRASGIAGFDPQEFRAGITNAIGYAYDTVANAYSSIGSYYSGFISMVNQIGSTERSFLTNIYTPTASLQSAVNTYLSMSSKVINYQPAYIESIRSSINDFYSDFESVVMPDLTIVPSNDIYYYAGPYSVPVVDPYVDYQLVQLIKGLDFYELYTNQFSKNFIKSDFINQSTAVNSSLEYIDLNNIEAVSYYVIKGGDTIEGIALSTLGNSKYWKSIAEFNGLTYPYVSNVYPSPEGTRGPGETLAIPNRQGASSANNLVLGTNSSNLSNPARALGNDLTLDSKSDVVFVDGDLSLVSGVSNIKQAIFLKLNVRKGELPLHQYYGLSDLRGYRTLNLLSAKASAEFYDTLSSDSRVAEVTSSSVTVSGDILNYSAEVEVRLTNQPIILEGSLALSA